MGCVAQLAARWPVNPVNKLGQTDRIFGLWLTLRMLCPSERPQLGVHQQVCACSITSLYVLAVMIYVTLVNTQTHTHTDSVDKLILLAQPNELKSECPTGPTLMVCLCSVSFLCVDFYVGLGTCLDERCFSGGPSQCLITIIFTAVGIACYSDGCICHDRVRLSVCPSVHLSVCPSVRPPSHSGVLSRRMKLRSCGFHRHVGQSS